MPALALIPWWVWLIIGIVVVIGLFEFGAWFLYKYIWTSCQLQRGIVTRDKCGGTCPPSQTCVCTGTKPYGPLTHSTGGIHGHRGPNPAIRDLFRSPCADSGDYGDPHDSVRSEAVGGNHRQRPPGVGAHLSRGWGGAVEGFDQPGPGSHRRGPSATGCPGIRQEVAGVK